MQKKRWEIVLLDREVKKCFWCARSMVEEQLLLETARILGR